MIVDVSNFYISLFTLLSISSVKKYLKKKFQYLNNDIIIAIKIKFINLSFVCCIITLFVNLV